MRLQGGCAPARQPAKCTLCSSPAIYGPPDPLETPALPPPAAPLAILQQTAPPRPEGDEFVKQQGASPEAGPRASSGPEAGSSGPAAGPSGHVTATGAFVREKLHRRRAIHCAPHREADEVLVESRECRLKQCRRTANYVSPGGLISCSAHKPSAGALSVVVKKACAHGNCARVPRFGERRKPGDPTDGELVCALHRRPNDHHVYATLCRFPEGCGKRASFGLPRVTPDSQVTGTNSSAATGVLLFCKMHALPCHVNLNGPVCRTRGCVRIASFGDPRIFKASGDERTRVGKSCKEHRKPGDVAVRMRFCDEGRDTSLRCDRRGTFGNSTHRYCASHVPPGISRRSLVSVLCQGPGCDRHAPYGPRGGKPILCRFHKSEGHINLKLAVCSEANCSLSARYGPPESRTPVTCALHKIDLSVDMRSRPCVQEGCGRLAYFASLATPRVATHCRTHHTQLQVDVRSKKCSKAGCFKQPAFGFEGQRPVACKEHRAEGHVDVKNPRCDVVDCGRRSMVGRLRRCVRHVARDAAEKGGGE